MVKKNDVGMGLLACAVFVCPLALPSLHSSTFWKMLFILVFTFPYAANGSQAYKYLLNLVIAEGTQAIGCFMLS